MKCRELRTNTLNSENPNQQFECQHIKYAVETFPKAVKPEQIFFREDIVKKIDETPNMTADSKEKIIRHMNSIKNFTLMKLFGTCYAMK